MKRLALALGLLAWFLLFYVSANRFSPYPAIQLPRTFIDDSIPFAPQTMWIYMSCYAFAPILFFSLRSARVLQRFVAGFMGAVFVAGVIFWFYPTTMPREGLSLEGQSEFMRALFEAFWKIDAPQNCWPSLHVTISFLAAFAIVDDVFSKPRPSRAAIISAVFTLVWATAITVSTISVRQHYFWDGVGGLALAILSYGIARLPRALAGRS